MATRRLELTIDGICLCAWVQNDNGVEIIEGDGLCLRVALGQSAYEARKFEAEYRKVRLENNQFRDWYQNQYEPYVREMIQYLVNQDKAGLRKPVPPSPPQGKRLIRLLE